MLQNINLNFNRETNTILLIMRGNLRIGNKSYEEKNILILEREEKILSFQTSKNFKALILNGRPIDEPIVAHGPFVMNSKQEILTAIDDYQNGLMEKNI